MKVRSAILTEMSGKLGGAVASTARGGVQYFRKLVTPRNPNTFLQTSIRASVASVASYWKDTLDEAQREAWWDLATGGQTGQGLFAKVNNPRRYAAISDRYGSVDTGGLMSDVILVAPPESFSTLFTQPTVAIDDSANQMTLSDIDPSEDWNTGSTEDDPAIIYVYASHQQTASRLSRQHPYQLIKAAGYTHADDPEPTTFNIPLAALGFTTEAGKVMYVKIFVQRRDGALSIPVERRVTIVA